jgi:hypothetical protein
VDARATPKAGAAGRKTTAKARGATGGIKDAFGDRWDISEFRGTVHGFEVWAGRAANRAEGEAVSVREASVLKTR